MDKQTTKIVSKKKLKNLIKILKLFSSSKNEIQRIFQIIALIFCCFDKGKLVVLFNGFQKKSQKTPKNELEKALNLMKEYFQQKNI